MAVGRGAYRAESEQSMIPIFLISYNRPTVLRACIERFQQLGQERIIVLDNCSNYEPLLDYYSGLRGVQVVRLRQNYGSKVMGLLWNSLRQEFGLDKTHYAYTDGDVVPTEDCPSDFLDLFISLLAADETVNKVGFGLKIDDLPSTFKARDDLVVWESQFWKKEITFKGFPFYRAAIDTTFAVRRPGSSPGWTPKAIRSGSPYLVRHLPWYIDTERLSSEDLNYIRTMHAPTMGHNSHFPGRYDLHAEKVRREG